MTERHVALLGQRLFIVVALLAVSGCACATPDAPDGAVPDAHLDASLEACASSAERCNGADDDCDGRVDEGYDLTSDPAHCGGCDVSCESEDTPTGFQGCVEGVCREVLCESDRRNCDGVSANGCESDLRSNEDCGACGRPCALLGAQTSCAEGTCELVACLPGYADCDGRPENGCEVVLEEDLFHCGACGNRCTSERANSAAACFEGSCTLACDPGHGDCNGDELDGCETPLTVPSSCGGCGVSCGGDRLCVGSVDEGYRCADPPCINPPTRCGDSCVDLASDPNHCGECGVVCPSRPNARPTCDTTVCSFACDVGFGDCDGDALNGCETPLNTATDCSACGVVCPVGVGVCSLLACVVTCPTGFADCDEDLSNGCEVELASDPSHCGACGDACASGVCASSLCEECPAGRADCDGAPATGCEVDLLLDEANCGACGDTCPLGQSCSAGTCSRCPEGCGCEHVCPAAPEPCFCSPGCPCSLTCEGGTNCDVTCEAGSSCSLQADGAATLSPYQCEGGAACKVSVVGASGVSDATCTGAGTQCTFDCSEASVCEVSCTGGAACAIVCTAGSDCEFDDCDGGQTRCTDDMVVCNQPCPG